jgi:DNA-binding MarR family transcriptional regulator
MRMSPVRFRKQTEESIIHALFDLSNHLMRRGEQLAAEANLTTQQWIVLLQIAGDPNFPGPRPSTKGVLPSEIASARGVTRATVSIVVRGLVERGLVEQRTDEADKRRRLLLLTRAGEKALASLQPTRLSANRRLLSRLNARQRKSFLQALECCLETLEELARADD